MIAAQPPSAAHRSPSGERRTAPRFEPAFGVVCRFDPDADGRPVVGLVWNLSATGVSVVMTEPPEMGAVLAADLELMTADDVLPLLVRVVFTRELDTGDFLVGAEFLRTLRVAEMDPYVG